MGTADINENFTGADITGADLEGAYLSEANTTRANLTRRDSGWSQPQQCYLERLVLWLDEQGAA